MLSLLLNVDANVIVYMYIHIIDCSLVLYKLSTQIRYIDCILSIILFPVCNAGLVEH